ncbi:MULTISPECIES: sensor histidine kinase [Bacillaceae]|uniref:sensor histidine kinase n=1 Tax=Bacillaceae TaxID=186817 RepID=UPI000BED555A|nr:MULTISPECIES: ATP-binding protein [unclassified Bacillus (in: firmicutes)]PEC49369.1 two-component sensor histidine kinase [Bacillus sp. AFS096315]PFM82385.1 two-component sensor histidine kinase [Bacillus sp. AFS077874]
MKITTKINLLITSWILIILILINGLVFYLFMKTTVNMEEHVVSQKAHEILKKHEIHNSLVINEEALYPFMSNHSYIRIIDPNSNIVTEISNDKLLNRIKPKFTKKEETKLIPFSEHQNIVVRVPILQNQKVIGTLEIGELLVGLEGRKDLLLTIMAIVIGVSAILSMMAGSWLTRIIMNPITSMITTMEDIEKSGVPKKILIKNETKDELHKMASTFNRMISRLQENIEKQKQFVSDASHELKTPITVISSFANLLRRRGLKNEEMATEAIETIYSEANRMQDLTKTLLTLAESEHLKNIEMNPVDLVALCNSTLVQLQNVYKREIAFHAQKQKILIKGNELKIKQVIIIFLDNAIKYSSDKIEVSISCSSESAILSIKDYGIGIREEELENIFERFYRVDKARSRETSGGTGLGLSIAKNIISLHNGKINIKSVENVGTEVEVVFPLDEFK